MQVTRMLGDALGRAIGFLPNILAALVILAVGLFVAKVLERITRRLLMAAGLDRRPAARKLLGQGARLERVPPIGGRIVYWLGALVTVGLAVDALHLAWLSAGVARVLAYVPNVLAAGAIVAVGYVASNFVYRRVTGRQDASLLGARLARGAILAVAAFMALQQLGIATAIVTVAFTVADPRWRWRARWPSASGTASSPDASRAIGTRAAEPPAPEVRADDVPRGRRARAARGAEALSFGGGACLAGGTPTAGRASASKRMTASRPSGRRRMRRSPATMPILKGKPTPWSKRPDAVRTVC